MKSVERKKTVYRVPPSKYWAQYWNTYLICSLATFQLLMTLAIAGMEIGNSLVDIYKANVFSGFWSFPFTISATLATYTSGKIRKYFFKLKLIYFQFVQINHKQKL